MKYRPHRTPRSSRRSVFLYRWRTLSLFFLAAVLMLVLCGCKKEEDPVELPDLHEYVSGLDTIGEGSDQGVLHEADAEAFLKEAGYYSMSGIKQAVLYAADDGPERLLAIEFIGETEYENGVVKLAEHLGVVKYTENCGGGINLHSDNCALVLYTYRYKGLGGLDNSVDVNLWVNQMDRAWLIMLQSLR